MLNRPLSCFGLVLCAGLLAACSSTKPLPTTTDAYTLGSAGVTVQVYASGTRPFTLFNMHDDENTAVEAGQVVIERHGGRVVTLAHTGDRLIAFTLDGTRYRFDPNRMFTDAGARRTLEREGAFSEAALEVVRTFADQVLAEYDLARGGAVVTVHNNTDQNYQATDYAPGGVYEQEAEAVHLEPGTDPDDFFFVTDRRFFDEAQAAGYNAVLQDNAQATDDGSLSVYCGREGIPYINVEAQHGHRTAQIQMLELISRLLP